MQKTTQKYDTCSKNITPSSHFVLVRIHVCGRKVEVTEHSLMIIQQLIFKLYGYWVFVIYVIKK